MPDVPSFTDTRADLLASEMPSILDGVRNAIVAGAGFPVGPGTIRVRIRELNKAAHERALELTPTGTAGIAAVAVLEPDLLETQVNRDDNTISVAEALRQEIADRIVSKAGTAIHVGIRAQYAGVDFASVVEEIRSTLGAVREVAPRAAEALERECDNQMSKTTPSGRTLLRPIDQARGKLADAGRMGDKPKFVHARVLMEMADVIDSMGWQLDKTHVPPAAPAP